MSMDIRMVPWTMARPAYDKVEQDIDHLYYWRDLPEETYRHLINDVWESKVCHLMDRNDLYARGYLPKRDED